MEENAPLALMGFKKLAGEAFIEPGSLQFVHEVADGETAITEQVSAEKPLQVAQLHQASLCPHKATSFKAS